MNYWLRKMEAATRGGVAVSTTICKIFASRRPPVAIHIIFIGERLNNLHAFKTNYCINETLLYWTPTNGVTW
jgi:hypothetical protein